MQAPDDNELIQAISTSLEWHMPATADPEAFRRNLASHINDLILHRFEYLVSLLYRMDVSEKKINLALQHNPSTDAGMLIADLVIERQMEKIKSRRQYYQRDDEMDENEKW